MRLTNSSIANLKLLAELKKGDSNINSFLKEYDLNCAQDVYWLSHSNPAYPQIEVRVNEGRSRIEIINQILDETYKQWYTVT